MGEKISEIFGTDVFNETVMQERLPKATFKALKKTMENGDDLDPQIADVVASVMKDWAIEKGATHYSHWFQPMTGVTAEKHDAFIAPASEGKIIMEFSGKELIKGEPDASSFPSGGLRATFEARGYTAWDCTSPAFVKEDAAGVTLCIPTAFCSYTGDALDKKTPLLRSMEAINRETVRALHMFGKNDVTHVSCSVGPEQEYFLVDHESYMKRADLRFTGRTLFGAVPPKGQEMDDHYFGAIKERVASFMSELNHELWKLGVYAKTQHNEAAPAQHELAPIYSLANTAVDHNQITMDLMKKVAKRHGLECLLHEKPFKGVNGSGKHNNWSIITNTGENLMKPGKKPNENTQFLFFLAAVMKAVDDHALLLRYSASNPGNDLRLGAAEAPPAIISIFLGEQLSDIVEQVINNGKATDFKKNSYMNIGVHTLPEIKKDATDRNRTSPFAFTGNKFEFRSVASSLSVAGPNTVLNTIVADVLSEYCDELEKYAGTKDFEDEVMKLIRREFKAHERIIFNGNGYAEEWVKEAERRGLPNEVSVVGATKALLEKSTVETFERQHVLNKAELEARAEISYEIYSKTLNIEARTMLEMYAKLFAPAVIKFEKELAEAIGSIRNVSDKIDTSVETELLEKISLKLKEARLAEDKLEKALEEAVSAENAKCQAEAFNNKVFPAMETLRKPVDELEMLVGKDYWPVPTYGDLLYEI
ncbi:MAG: glutamine synthetase III [Lachnospiraceae bacterium]|nr:glutamine synthetase III [Lachnospiraceae bacterium]